MNTNGSVEVGITGERNVNEIKEALKTIEGLFNAVNVASFPLTMYHQAMKGMAFLRNMHTELIKQLTPEEIEQAKKEDREMVEAKARQSSMPQDTPPMTH